MARTAIDVPADPADPAALAARRVLGVVMVVTDAVSLKERRVVRPASLRLRSVLDLDAAVVGKRRPRLKRDAGGYPLNVFCRCLRQAFFASFLRYWEDKMSSNGRL